MKTILRSIVIDDHPSMRANLTALLGDISTVEVVAEAEGVEDGLVKISEYQPDLIFLDVEMEDGTGFDLLSRLRNPSLKVIFVTGHNDFAIKAFRFSAIDYLLKPVDFDDLEESVEKALNKQINSKQIENLLSNQKKLNRIVLSDQKTTYLIDLENIIRVESDVNYAQFFLTDGRAILIAKTLKYYSELLSMSGFFRAHQSHLINLRHFDRLDKRQGATIFMKSGDAIPVSTRKREELLKALLVFAENQ